MFGVYRLWQVFRTLVWPTAMRRRARRHLLTSYPQSPAPLDHLEAESLHILREVAAECRNPVMLYSIGKDSSVLLHLLLKAFAPAVPPIPLLHVDTTWKFREMIDFRDQIGRAHV